MKPLKFAAAFLLFWSVFSLTMGWWLALVLLVIGLLGSVCFLLYFHTTAPISPQEAQGAIKGGNAWVERGVYDKLNKNLERGARNFDWNDIVYDYSYNGRPKSVDKMAHINAIMAAYEKRGWVVTLSENRYITFSEPQVISPNEPKN